MVMVNVCEHNMTNEILKYINIICYLLHPFFPNKLLRIYAFTSRLSGERKGINCEV